MNFRTYLKESVEAQQVYKFYALDFILSAGNKQPFDGWELEQVRSRYKSVKYQLWKDLCADGIRAIVGEMRHADMEITNLDLDSPEYVTIQSIAEDAQNVIHAVGRGRSTTQRGSTEISLSELEGAIKREFGSMDKLFMAAISVFEDYVWSSEYGGQSWGDITRAVRELYKNKENLSSDKLDHILDLAHNMGNWLNKFPNGSTIGQALDKKFSAKTPHDFKDEIHDREIRKWLGKALIEVPKGEQSAPYKLEVKYVEATHNAMRLVTELHTADYGTKEFVYLVEGQRLTITPLAGFAKIEVTFGVRPAGVPNFYVLESYTLETEDHPVKAKNELVDSLKIGNGRFEEWDIQLNLYAILQSDDIEIPPPTEPETIEFSGKMWNQELELLSSQELIDALFDKLRQ